MITHARWGCWETNSSTMNQIAIYPSSTDLTICVPREIVLNYDFPSDGGDMIKDPIHKIRLVWAMIKEIEHERDYEWSQEHINDHAEDFDVEKFRETFYSILDRYGISYTESDEDECVGILGMSGMSHEAAMLFLAPENLEWFLFNPNSMFTFGHENAWPYHDELGYTDESAEGYNILEV